MSAADKANKADRGAADVPGSINTLLSHIAKGGKVNQNH